MKIEFEIHVHVHFEDAAEIAAAVEKVQALTKNLAAESQKIEKTVKGE